LNLTFYKQKLNVEIAKTLTSFDSVCVFVNDSVNKDVLNELKNNGINLVALRCAGFNNVDLKAAKEFGIKVVRVPKYSPESIA